MQKGITPVIAVILLLLITIAIVGFAFTFFQRTAQTATQAGQTQLASQINQTNIRFAVENVDKNKVYIRNLGANSITLSSLAFYVNDQSVEAAGPASLATNVVGQYFLNDSKLAMLPDPATLKVTGGIVSDTRINTCFYCKYYAGYWKLDEGSGITAADSSGNNNHATLSNTSVQWISGVYGNALSCDGVDDEATANDAASLKQGNDWTISAWIKDKNTPGVDKIAVGKTGWHGGLIHQGSSIYFRIYNNVGSNKEIGYTPTIGAWSHYTATYNASNGIMNLYVDSVLVGTNTFNIPPMLAYSNTLYMCGSANSGFTNYHSPVDLDEVKIMGIARTMMTG